MTTTVIVKAHCSSDKHVVVELATALFEVRKLMQNGEVAEFYAYDERVITVKEELKP